MVHRPPDSRLLTNLIHHEKDYTKHLFALFPLSHAALTSLSAYAIASPSSGPQQSSVSPSQTLTGLVEVLASSDDALHRYTQAVERWREELAGLKDLEEDVGAVLRDREILVTRLIKASSKSNRHPRDPSNSSSLNAISSSGSMSSLPSSSSLPGTTNTKLSQAQVELQACEAHLAAKEQELEVKRVEVVREGLGARCKALLDCGWVWGEMGKEGLRLLDLMGRTEGGDTGNGHAHSHQPFSMPFPSSASPSPSFQPDQNKPLPLPALPPNLTQTSYASDISSLTPSQSVSQQMYEDDHDAGREGERRHQQEPQHYTENQENDEQREVTLNIPAAHAISELAMPTGVSSPSASIHATPHREGTTLDLSGDSGQGGSAGTRRRRSTQKRRPLSRRITEEEEEEDSPLEQFSSGPSFSFAREGGRRDDSSEEEQGPIAVVENQPFARTKGSSGEGEVKGSHTWGRAQGKQRERKASSIGIFGSIRGLFKSNHKEKDLADIPEPDVPFGIGRKKGKGKWATRTDANLKANRKDGGDSSDSEHEPVTRPELVTRLSTSSSPPTVGGGGKLRKGRGRSPTTPTPARPGWESDNPSPSTPRGTVKRRKSGGVNGKGKGRGNGQAATDGEVEHADETVVPVIMRKKSQTDTEKSAMRPALVRSVSPVPHGQTYQPPAGETSLSRSSSLSRGSIMSAPPMSNPSSAKARQRRSTTDTIMVSANDHERIWDISTGKDTTPRRASSDTYGSPTPRANKALSESDSTPTSRGKGKQKQKSGSTYTNQYPSANGSSKDTSLMSIVENVTRQNREGWSASYGVPPSNVLRTAAGASRPQNSSVVKLEVPKAPSPGVPVNRSTGQDVKYNIVNGNGSSKAPTMDIPRAPGSVIPASSTEPPPLQHPQPISAASTGQLLTPGTSSIIRGASRPAKSPLRSALKNPSRTPSPVPDQIIRRKSAQEEPGEQRRGRTPERQVANGGPPQVSASRTKVADSDTNSISSYATGRESFEDTNGVPPPPPPHDHEGTASTTSTSTETQLPRRKSVRVSLQPTFSPTPPALDDDDDDDDDERAGKGGRYAPWGPNGNGGKGEETRDGRTSEEKDVWEDSSEEDEEYRRARRLLMRVGKKGKGKGKGKGKTA